MRGWKSAFYAVCAAELLATAGFTTSVPILPFLFQDELGVRDPAALNLWVGASATAVAAALAVFAPIWGRLADSYGKRLMLLRSMAAGTVVMGLMGAVAAPWQVVLLRAMQGALTGTVSAATVLVASLAPPEEAGASQGLFATAVYAGSSVGPAIGGLLSDAFGHRVTFYATAAMILAGGLIVLRFVPRDVRAVPAEGPLWRRVLPDFTVLAQSRSLATLLVVSATIQVATSLVAPVLPLYVQSLSADPARVATMTGLILGLAALTGALAAAGLGRASRRIGYTRMLAFCLAGAFLTAVPQAFVHTPLQLLLLRAAGGAFLGGTMPAVNALISRMVQPGKQGSIYGLSASVNNVGGSVGPMIGAAVAAAAGTRWVFAAMGAALVAAGAAGAFLRRPAR